MEELISRIEEQAAELAEARARIKKQNEQIDELLTLEEEAAKMKEELAAKNKIIEEYERRVAVMEREIGAQIEALAKVSKTAASLDLKAIERLKKDVDELGEVQQRIRSAASGVTKSIKRYYYIWCVVLGLLIAFGGVGIFQLRNIVATINHIYYLVLKMSGA